jgi:hypothetical protein
MNNGESTSKRRFESNAAPQEKPRPLPSAEPVADSLAAPLPWNQSAEISVLGAILLHNDGLIAVIKTLIANDFFLSQHQLIFSRMIDLHHAHHPIDPITLIEALNRDGKLEAAGGLGYLSQLSDGVPRISNVGHYARLVKEKSVLRQLIHVTQAIQEIAMKAQDDLGRIINRAVTELNGPAAETMPEGITTDLPSSPMVSACGLEVLCQNQTQTWIVDGLVAKGSVNIAAGDSEIGKSPLRRRLVTEECERGIDFLTVSAWQFAERPK